MIDSDREYPTTMSCRDAFDMLTRCYSFSGQFRNYYRYGELNNCHKQLAKFKFCMLHGSDPIKVQEWYRDVELEREELKLDSDLVWTSK